MIGCYTELTDGLLMAGRNSFHLPTLHAQSKSHMEG